MKPGSKFAYKLQGGPITGSKGRPASYQRHWVPRRMGWQQRSKLAFESRPDYRIPWPRTWRGITSVRWMPRSVPQIRHDCFLPNPWLTRISSSHRIPKCTTSAVGTALLNWGSITKANHNATRWNATQGNRVWKVCSPLTALTSDFAAKWLEEKLNEEYSLQQYVDKYLKWTGRMSWANSARENYKQEKKFLRRRHSIATLLTHCCRNIRLRHLFCPLFVNRFTVSTQFVGFVSCLC